MNSVIILTNIKKYPYHSKIIDILKISTSPFIYLDVNPSALSEIAQHLSSSTPDLIITLDLAGFELRTFTGECFFNMLPCKICNIIWGDKPEYSNYLSGKLSLSMLFYDANGCNNQLPSKYPYVRYYYPTSQAIPTIPTDSLETHTFETFKEIWKHFTKEVLM